jgi:hypothetical protein
MRSFALTGSQLLCNVSFLCQPELADLMALQERYNVGHPGRVPIGNFVGKPITGTGAAQYCKPSARDVRDPIYVSAHRGSARVSKVSSDVFVVRDPNCTLRGEGLGPA